jgi:hypothetical protein
MKYWEIIADNLSKAGWSWGCISAVDSNGRTFWIADAHRDDGAQAQKHTTKVSAKDVGCPTSDIRYQGMDLRGPTFLVGDGWLSVPDGRVCFLLCALRLRSCICPFLFCHKTWTFGCNKCACPC